MGRKGWQPYKVTISIPVSSDVQTLTVWQDADTPIHTGVLTEEIRALFPPHTYTLFMWGRKSKEGHDLDGIVPVSQWPKW